MTKITLDEYLAEIEKLRERSVSIYGLPEDVYQCIHAARTKEPRIPWRILADWLTERGLISIKRSALAERYKYEKKQRGNG